MLSPNILLRTRNFMLLRPFKQRKCFVPLQYAAYSDWIPKDPVTHTGQQWSPDDYRLARFIDKPKQVNPNIATQLSNSVAPEVRKERVVWCDGGSGAEGHPKVYINLEQPGAHYCNYCNKRFILDASH